MSDNRITWLDSCKGFAIILVVIGHIADGYLSAGLFDKYVKAMEITCNVLYPFHMPLFFCISGFVFYIAYLKKCDEKKKQIKLQIINNVCIYTYWSCIQWVTKMIFVSNINKPFTVIDLLLLPIKPMTPYWYLYVLIFLYMIVYLFIRFKFDDKILLIGFLPISLLSDFITIDLIFPFQTIMKYSVFFFVGVLLPKYIKNKISIPIYILCGVMSFAVIACAVFFNINIFKIKFIGIFAAMVVSLFIIFTFEKVKAIGKFKTLEICGRYSLEIYVTHCFITAGNRIILFKFGITNFYLNLILNLLMAVFIPIGCAVILKKLNIHKLFFRPVNYFVEKKTV